jgi:hypothetical protein
VSYSTGKNSTYHCTGTQKRLGIDLGGIESLLQVAAGAAGDLADVTGLLLLDLTTGSAESLACMSRAVCTAASVDAAGAAREECVTGLDMLLQALQNTGGSECSRAYAAALLGNLAPCGSSAKETSGRQARFPGNKEAAGGAAAEGSESGSEDEGSAEAAPQRGELLEKSALEPMVQV